MEGNHFITHFLELEDPRIERTKKHNLLDIIAITLCATLCGFEHYTEIEDYAKENEDWLKTFLELPNGIPSHDTIRRVLGYINPMRFQSCFADWLDELKNILPCEIIAIDGKTLRGSGNNKKNRKPLHIVNAWAVGQRLVLGQVAVDEKSNEITAIPLLLEQLVLKNAIITIDAMGCQKKIAEQIIKQEGNYVLAVKENQKALYTKIETLFSKAQEQDFCNQLVAFDETLDYGHGRIEQREYGAMPVMYLHSFKKQWTGLESVIYVKSKRIIGDTESLEVRYFISSIAYDQLNQKIATAIRQHWCVENQLHWQLDISFHEDNNLVRDKIAAENLAWLRRFCLSLLQQETSFKASMRRKKLKCLMNKKYLVKTLYGI